MKTNEQLMATAFLEARNYIGQSLGLDIDEPRRIELIGLAWTELSHHFFTALRMERSDQED